MYDYTFIFLMVCVLESRTNPVGKIVVWKSSVLTSITGVGLL